MVGQGCIGKNRTVKSYVNHVQHLHYRLHLIYSSYQHSIHHFHLLINIFPILFISITYQHIIHNPPFHLHFTNILSILIPFPIQSNHSSHQLYSPNIPSQMNILITTPTILPLSIQSYIHHLNFISLQGEQLTNPHPTISLLYIYLILYIGLYMTD